MNRWKSVFAFVTALAAAAPAVAQNQRFEVTITNLTRGQRFTPVLVASHEEGVKIFEVGKPASPQLRTLAEEGNVAPLAALLTANPKVGDVKNSPPPPPATNLIAPGGSVTVEVEGSFKFSHFSVAAMLIPTNDAFFAVNGMQGPRFFEQEVTYLVPAYDAGTERNDELCASIPGPGFEECRTPSNPSGDGGGAQAGNGEGFVHIHGGMHGIGNMNAAMRDWRNPVARITIRRGRN